MKDSNKLPEADSLIIGQIVAGGVNRRRGEDALFTAYMYFIREGCRKYTLTEDEAFDAYSDTILSAIDAICNGTFEKAASLKTYVYKIFQHKCVDLIRKKTTNKNKVHQTVSITDMLLHESDATRSTLQKLADQSDEQLLKERLATLGYNCKQLLLLSADGLTDREIAEMMEYKTADVVKTSRLRCLDKLRRLYNQI